MRSPWKETPRRRALWFALIAAVLVAHVGVGLQVAAAVIGWDGGPPMPRRIDVALVQELLPAEPSPVAARPPEPPAPPRRRVVRPRRAASAPVRASAAEAMARAASAAEEAASAASAAALAMAASAPEPIPAPAPAAASAPSAIADASTPSGSSAASAPASPASAAALASAGAASSPLPSGTGEFQWPPSTRLTYTVGGWYRGELHGTAQVEWRRQEDHYQVEVDTEVGLVATTRSVSDGRIGAEGLVPETYDELLTIGPSQRHQHVDLGPDDIVLTNGKMMPRPARVQDAASQFVQFVYLFALHPDWLQPGRVIEMPLALPKRVGTWLYEVHEPELLYLPFGMVSAIRLSPRPESVGPHEIAVEMWIVPTLQYLPAQVRMTQGDSRLLLTLDKRPLQAAPVASAPPPAGPAPSAARSARVR